MKMKMTLPTDRNCNLYYGCTTFRQAEKAIRAAKNAAIDYNDDSFDRAAMVASIVEAMEGAGFNRAAARVRNTYK